MAMITMYPVGRSMMGIRLFQILAWEAPPGVVHVDNITKPDVDVLKSKFGMSYTSAHVIKPKLAKMLNAIQAPKQMYSSILKWR
jgi:hypothetical protein